MIFGCSHRWYEQDRYFTGSCPPTKVEGMSAERPERLIWGVTTITLRCRHCGDVKATEVKGDARIRVPKEETA